MTYFEQGGPVDASTPMVEGTCKVCGERWPQAMWNLHIEDHMIRGEFPRTRDAKEGQ